MVSHRNTHSCGNIVKKKNTEKKPIPTVIPKIIRNRGDGQNCSKNEKATRNPLHPIEWYILKHAYYPIQMNQKGE
jgi:hypothetical protein